MTTAQKVKAPADKVMVAQSLRGNWAKSYSLADSAVAGRVAALREKINSSPAEAIKFLKLVGVLNRAGKLAKKFGG